MNGVIMKRRSAFLVMGIAVVAVAIWAAWGSRSEEPADLAVEGTTPAHSAGLVVQIDPATGEPVVSSGQSVAGGAAASLGDALSTSSEGLVEQESPVPGGGVMVDLQGRFRNTAVATVSDSGDVTTDCLPGSPHDHDAHASDAGGEQ
jgi:hypothetical protein